MVEQQTPSFESLVWDGILLAEVLWSTAETIETKFYSDSESFLQLGLMTHAAGFIEIPHTHPEMYRGNLRTQQLFVVTRGLISVDFFTYSGQIIKEYQLRIGDSILIIDGVHRIRVHEDSRCITVKQGPFPGVDFDKIEVKF